MFRYIKFSLMITLGPYDSGVGGQNTYVSSHFYNFFSIHIKINIELRERLKLLKLSQTCFRLGRKYNYI